MARVLVKRLPWGTLWEKDPTTRVLKAPLAGQAASLSTTVYSGATGDTEVTSFVTDSNGDLPGWVEEGSYIQTVNGVATQVEAMSGGLSGRVSTAEAHAANTANPHAVTKAQVGLGNVDNTSDVAKPVSTAQQTALNAKAASADVAVIREAAIDITYPEYNAPRGGANATPAIQAALDHAATADTRGQVIVPPGGFVCNGPLSMADGVSMVGAGFGNGHSGALYHNFNGGLINMSGGGTLENLSLIQNGAFTGAAIRYAATSTSHGFFQFRRLVITDSTADRGWENAVIIDGDGATDGARSIFMRDCQFFGTSGITVYLRKVVHCFMSNCEIVQSPQTTTVQSLQVLNSYSEDVQISGSYDANLYTEAAGSLVFTGRVRQGRTITCATGSDHNVFMGDVLRATFTNNGGASNRRVG